MEYLYNKALAYATSKVAQIMFTYKLNRIIEANYWRAYIHINACHPGVIETQLLENLRKIERFKNIERAPFCRVSNHKGKEKRKRKTDNSNF